MKTPVVFIIFNRPDPTARSFQAIRQARPEQLLVIADAARAGREGEEELCAATRAITEQVDWPCRVLRNYASENMGCGRRIASGMDWAFGQVEDAIILEDDCLPDPSFFAFCEEMLDRYRDDRRVMMVSGNNFQHGRNRTPDSYYFSRLPHCWGWATWRRAWELYDYDMELWPELRRCRLLDNVTSCRATAIHWERCLNQTASGRIDTWDYQWMMSFFANNGLSVAPAGNLVTNLGLGAADATHTTSGHAMYEVDAGGLEFPLRHPPAIVAWRQADALEERTLYPARRDYLLAAASGLWQGVTSGLAGSWRLCRRLAAGGRSLARRFSSSG